MPSDPQIGCYQRILLRGSDTALFHQAAEKLISKVEPQALPDHEVSRLGRITGFAKDDCS